MAPVSATAVMGITERLMMLFCCGAVMLGGCRASIDRMLEIKEMGIGHLSDRAYYYALELTDLKEDLTTKNITKNE